MSRLAFCLLFFIAACGTTPAQTASPQQSLNQYVAFLNQSVEEVIRRFDMVRAYQEDVTRYRNKPDFLLRLASSGPLEEFYYQKALAGSGLTASEKQHLNAGTEALWQLLTQLDQTGKALETYVRLKNYQNDNLRQSDQLISEMQAHFLAFSRDKTALFEQIQSVYRHYLPTSPTDPYLATEKDMEQILLSQQQLLDSLPYYLQEDQPTVWPVDRVQASMLADEKWLGTFGKAQSKIAYPASDMVNAFKSELLAIQAVKQRAIDENTYAARQSAHYGNGVYLSLIKQYNQGLLGIHRSFVLYSKSARPLLDYPSYSPVFTPQSSQSVAPTTARTVPFQDKPRPDFTLKPSATPASRALFETLNGYVEWINESLRQMHTLQVLVRNYQQSAEYYRDPARASQRANLTYSHEDFKVPLSAYQLLMTHSTSLPGPYRTAVQDQAEVLRSMLQEMDGLSIELISYTREKQYLQDRLTRSDAILNRYAHLFDTFDQKKEQLYTDIRRIYESYPAASPTSSWQVAGHALQRTLDEDHEILFGVKGYLKGEANQLPGTTRAETSARQLIADEYQNLKGLPRYGRSNGLCPYSPYEDLAENTSRFAGMAQAVKPVPANYTRHPYESFYYFYNNELVYQYNKFSELAAGKNILLLKAVRQPDLFILQRFPARAAVAANTRPSAKQGVPDNKPIVENKPAEKLSGKPANESIAAIDPQKPQIVRDTVYIKETRVDTVYIDRTDQREVTRSLAGFAANNMILLLDVSGSMDSPVKLPLLKRSIKSLLPLLRPEDQLSIVVYSGKARIALKPTSGAETAMIARVIDQLSSTGETDGNGGLTLAYKVANKQYIRAGNNRIILATDGEFPVSNEVLQLIDENARQDIFLTVFTFGRNPFMGKNLKKLSQAGRGTYTHVTDQTADLQLILEAQAKQVPSK
ncbi:vWA domain-containing protein [Salmonirosea aquatica]|uniref:VWA domain-containing protein n=1 Tax=Salmonirosea aquatica TaxID=2654236 RepID=A0A7C9FFX6_9BACT|nr:VWA domain-containing protein [Cytophagaceae bacterium SJW1-29]